MQPTVPQIRFEVPADDARQLHLVIDNPGARNGLTAQSCVELATHLDRASADPAVRCVIVRGAGDHFCAGADLRAGGATLRGTDDEIRSYITDGFHAVIRALAACQKPTLAVIRGACVGFGFDMALSCDLRIAASNATFGQVFSKIGLVPDGGSSFVLPRLVGLGKALELFYLAEKFDGQTAAAMGLVNRAVAPEELGALAADWSGRLASGPPIAYRLGKANLRAGAAGGELAAALAREVDAQAICLRSKDALIGVGAFFMKQTPKFEGK